MPEIVPRWEWRAFDPDFGDIRDRLAATGQALVRESAETYILSAGGEDNTKIRFELMDLKTLRQVDAHGLEQWAPLMKAGFPLEAEALTRILGSWAVVPEELAVPLDHQTFMHFVSEHPDLVAVAVTKRRHGWRVDECFVEWAEVSFDGQVQQTVCVEHADPERVWRVVGELGLQALPNTSYLAALKRHAGMEHQ